MLHITPRTSSNASVRTDLGSVATYVISPKKAVFVFDENKHDPLHKLPCGHIEPGDAGIIAAAKREVLEETGIMLLDSEIALIKTQRRDGGIYYPYFCLAHISEKELSARKKIGDEDGSPIKTRIFNRAELPMRLNMEFVPKHIQFIREIEGIE